MQDMEVCKNDTKMSDEEFSELMAQQMPKSPEGKCFIFCMMRSMTLMSEEGELNSEGCSAMIAEAPIDDDQKEKMKGMPEECAKEGCEKKEDPCETAYRISLCFQKKAEEVNKHIYF
uniref:Uncharacterized protein n=1 Tax=Rhodnius prolixus TaxID=13249 RepID=T1H963_RHOPR